MRLLGAQPFTPGHESGRNPFILGLARLFKQRAKHTEPAEALNMLGAVLDPSTRVGFERPKPLYRDL